MDARRNSLQRSRIGEYRISHCICGATLFPGLDAVQIALRPEGTSRGGGYVPARYHFTADER